MEHEGSGPTQTEPNESGPKQSSPGTAEYGALEHGALEHGVLEHGVRIGSDGGGRPVAVKRSFRSDARLRAQAEWLRDNEDPGVVRFVELRDGPDGPELVTEWVGQRSLADLGRPLLLDRAVGLCLAIGATIERLHRMGAVHGALESTHVLLDERSRPVLCSPAALSTPVHEDADRLALARLLLDLLGGPESSVEGSSVEGSSVEGSSVDGSWTRPIVDARRVLDRRLHRVRRRCRAELEPTDSDAHSSDRLRRFLDDLRRTVPGASLEPDASRVEPRVEPRLAGSTARRVIRVIPVAVLVAVLGAVGFVWAGGAPDRTNGTDPITAVSGDGSATTGTRSSPGSATTTQAPDTTTEVVEPTPSTGSPAPVVTVAGRTWSVGRSGDIAVALTGGCSPDPLVALLRPESAELFVFVVPTTIDGPVAPSSRRSVPGTTDLILGSAGDDPTACPELLLRSVSGELLPAFLGGTR